jgi:hypothetical protein
MLVFAIFVISFLLIVFYIWVSNNITAHAKNQAENIAAEVQFNRLFSELIKKHGIDIANKDTNDVEKLITNYATNSISIPKGEYSTSCSKNGIDQECRLTITLHETLSKLATYSLFVPSVNIVTMPAWILIKLIGLDELQNTQQESYLPVKPAQTMKFSLVMKVKFA